MLDDRPYMQNLSYGNAVSATKVLLIANVVIYVLHRFLMFYFPDLPFREYFFLSKEGIARGFVFQLVTYQFLHAGLMHLLGNMLIVYFMGKALEEVLGTKDFLMLYFTAGLVGGVFQIALAWMAPNTFGGDVVGASAAAFGLVAAFAQMFPERVITLLLFFVIPFSIKAQTLLWVAIGLSVFGIVVPDSNIAHGAHMGGIVVGVSYVHFVIRNSWRFSFPSFSRTSQKVVKAKVSSRSWGMGLRADDPSDEGHGTDFISKEIDPILEKISEHGIHSLTEKERKTLESARSRMGR